MKSKIKKVLALLLTISIAASGFQAGVVNAEDKMKSEQTNVTEVSESRLSYFYIESPYVETPDTQNVVMSWGDGSEDISQMNLTVADENGVVEEWACEKHAESLYLFSKEFADSDEKNTYQVTGINFVEGGIEKQFQLSDLGVEAEFGVNKAYDGIEELKPLEGGESEYDSSVEASVVTIDEDGQAQAEDSIAEALSEADVAGGKARMVQRSGDVVVALDPGHDNKHGGTTGSGLKEQDLTLKIANYAKEELETYGGIKVYMTRTSAECPYPDSGSSGDDIGRRVEAAAAQGAKIFVSFHLNSGASSANGAEIIIPNSSWKPQVAEDGKVLAEKIIDELEAVGLNKRPTPIYSKDTTINETYPDGSISDYFSVQIYAKEAGIPGIIIEHAFLSNSNDVSQFLNNEAGLKKLGVADATGIAKYLGLSKGKTGWVDENGKSYYYRNGKKVTGLQTIGEQQYYFDSDGVMQTGWQTIGKDTYYFYPSGSMVTGWLTIDGKQYYLGQDGKRRTGWLKLAGEEYYLDKNGVVLTGWQKIGEETYYFYPTGSMLTGWLTQNGKTYYFYPTGSMVVGKVTIDGVQYEFDSNGVLKEKSGWIKEGSNYYYYQNGKKATGWLTLDGKQYYLGQDGARRTGWLKLAGEEYYLDKNGVVLTGWQVIGVQTYYFYPTGSMLTGWLTQNGKTYYFYPTGSMVVGKATIDGKQYEFDEDGVLIEKKGWVKEGGNYYYYQDGKKATGWLTLDGKQYYLGQDGARRTGWLKLAGEEYYLDKNGVVLTGWQVIGVQTYYFYPTGSMLTGWLTQNGKTYYFYPTGSMVVGKATIDGKQYEFDEDGVLIEKKGWVKEGGNYYYYQDGKKATGWLTLDGKQYYLGQDGARRTGWLKLAGEEYYLDKNGVVLTGWQVIGVQTYYFYPTGSMLTGWLTQNGKTYYFYPTGSMVVGKVTIDGKQYEFDEDGVLIEKKGWVKEGGNYYYYQDGKKATGWLTLDGKQYYLGQDGARRTGWLKLAGEEYYLDKDGVVLTGWQKIGEETYYFYPTGSMLTGWLTQDGKTYYFYPTGSLIVNRVATIDDVQYYFDSEGICYEVADLTPISGTSETTIEKMVAYYNEKSPIEYPFEALGKGGAATIEEFCRLYYEEAEIEGIKAEVAFAQAMIETGYLKFGNDVKIEQFNFAGLGTVGNGEAGNSFPDVQTGIRAQIQHLKCYANDEELKQDLVDPRWGDWLRGKAPYVEWLSIPNNPNGTGWASDKDYGDKLLTIINQLK